MNHEIIKYIGKAKHKNSIINCEQITLKIFSAVPDSTDAIAQFITDAINEKIEREKLINSDIFKPLDKQINLTEHKPIELKNLKNPE